MSESNAVETIASAVTLTGSYAASQLRRIDSHSQVELFVTFVPVETNADDYLEIQPQYSLDPYDGTDPAGANMTWIAYGETAETSENIYTETKKTLRVASNLTGDNLKPRWAPKPVAAKAYRVRYREIGVTSFGTVTVNMTAQRI